MRRAVLALALVCAATGAEAQRLSTTEMSCPQAQAAVRQAGGIVLGTGGMTYDRFVRDRSFCEPTEITKAAFAPTRTDQNCMVGFTCYEPGIAKSSGW
ncbi:hypothetical protein [Methylobacterium sp. sgz302541]|uniref:hypothetical protein n=1 Tax=unclassified Methylobacterium TaxID=2615210 RepID=UPI003D3527E8